MTKGRKEGKLWAAYQQLRHEIFLRAQITWREKMIATEEKLQHETIAVTAAK